MTHITQCKSRSHTLYNCAILPTIPVPQSFNDNRCSLFSLPFILFKESFSCGHLQGSYNAFGHTGLLFLVQHTILKDNKSLRWCHHLQNVSHSHLGPNNPSHSYWGSNNPNHSHLRSNNPNHSHLRSNNPNHSHLHVWSNNPNHSQRE